MAKPDRERRPAATRTGAARRAAESLLVDEASEESFPASDPPPYTVCGVGTPRGRSGRKPGMETPSKE